MSKLGAFVRLDFATIKPYFSRKNIMLYIAVMLFLTIMIGESSFGIVIGIWIATMFIGYSFTVGDKCNMDALYVTLSVDRQTVVLGRYVFTFLLNVCTILSAYVVATVGIFAAQIAGYASGTEFALWAIIPMVAFILIIQALQLPLYFRFGYTKAKFISVLPNIAMIAGIMAFGALNRSTEISSRIDEFINPTSSGWLTAGAVLALCFVVFISFRLSLAFYRKREF